MWRKLGLALWLAAMTAAAQAAPTRTIEPKGGPIPVGRGLFGVNYVWHLWPASAFPSSMSTLNTLGASLVRYPGGWVAEHFDWINNRVGGNRIEAQSEPGIDPDAFLQAVHEPTFVTPSLPATRDPSRIAPLTARTVRLVERFRGRVRLWEIGNEWWLQRGAKNDPAARAENFSRYAGLLASVAPAIKRADPQAIVFATGDWTKPAEFGALREAVGLAGWAAIDGVSIHPYCGNLDPQTLCTLIPARAEAIRQASGKTRLYASEWSLGTKVTSDDWGIRNAALTIAAFRQLAAAGIADAAYWPPMRGAPEIALMTEAGQPTATGLLFGWVAHALAGEMLPLSDPASIAGRVGREVTIIVPALATPGEINLPLAPFGATRLQSAQLMRATDPNDPVGSREASIETLPVRVENGVARFSLDAWQIARVTLQP
jgi:hypothetical protein